MSLNPPLSLSPSPLDSNTRLYLVLLRNDAYKKKKRQIVQMKYSLSIGLFHILPWAGAL